MIISPADGNINAIATTTNISLCARTWAIIFTRWCNALLSLRKSRWAYLYEGILVKWPCFSIAGIQYILSGPHDKWSAINRSSICKAHVQEFKNASPDAVKHAATRIRIKPRLRGLLGSQHYRIDRWRFWRYFTYWWRGKAIRFASSYFIADAKVSRSPRTAISPWLYFTVPSSIFATTDDISHHRDVSIESLIIIT